ncbi:FecR family protein [Pseudomonas xanthosomatis]|uniref:FecR family protein n=1 Tax=Pseudomonas xanthosomatis TaxID=2842356 RepID=UPI001C3D6DBD|nr:FecR family protein [Pseudomonas xanthosomatis]QXH47765.1 FecR family protein [Pseudomonas xanthosomatis]
MSLEPPITAEQSQAAMRWLGRNQQPGQADSAAFKRWLLQDAAHRRAYAEAEQLWQLSEAPAARLAAEQQADLAQYLDAIRRPARTAHWRRFAVAACLVLALGGAAGWQPQHWLQDLRADYTSGEQVRQVTLADNSQLTLDAGSAVAVDFAHGQRRVRLLRGAAYFQVTHTGAPFVVAANGGQVRVLGTQFEVREQGAGTRVTVHSGRVAVTPVPGAPPSQLTADQQLVYADGTAGRVEQVDSDSRLAWRQGWLNYYQVPLGQVVDDLRRYYPGRILLLDDALAQRKVSGSFPLDEPLLALDSLGKVLGFERQTVLGRFTVLR